MTIMNFIRKNLGLPMKYGDPKLVKKYCKGKGLEIGGASHATFHFNALNVDMVSHDNPDDIYHQEQMKLAGCVKKVDIIAKGDDIPIEDNSVDFVFSSHVIEHFYNPVSAINEWLRVVKPNKYVVLIVPHKERTFDSKRDCTTIEEFETRHKEYNKDLSYPDQHYGVWTTETFLEFAKHFGFNVIAYEDVVVPRFNNSFGIVIKKSERKS